MFVNFGLNLFSLYDVGNPDPIFQIDANLAYPSVLLVSRSTLRPSANLLLS
jgi:alpha-L-fucosidase 2